MIAAQAPYIDYTPEEAAAFVKELTEEQRRHYADRGWWIDDPETFYVLKRFAEAVGLDKPEFDDYTRALFQNARRYTPRDFAEEPYLKAVRFEPQRIGRFTLTRATYSRGELFQYDMPDVNAPLTVPRLGFCSGEVSFPAVYEGNMPWMSVCPSEINSMKKQMRQAHGRVLVLGLGLGYYPFAVSQKDNVQSVDIIELSDEVIRLFNEQLLPHFPARDKIRVIRADAFAYLEKLQGGEYDFCFADIWEGAEDGAECYARMRPLAARMPSTEFTYWIEDVLRWYLLQG